MSVGSGTTVNFSWHPKIDLCLSNQVTSEGNDVREDNSFSIYNHLGYQPSGEKKISHPFNGDVKRSYLPEEVVYIHAMKNHLLSTPIH